MKNAAKLGEGRRRSIAKPLKTLGEGCGEGRRRSIAKSLKSLGRRLAKVAKRRYTPYRGATYAAPTRAKAAQRVAGLVMQ